MTFRLLLRALVLTLLLLPARLLADAVVTFNEIHYSPPGSQDGEWIELHNQMAVNIDLSRWSLRPGTRYRERPSDSG